MDELYRSDTVVVRRVAAEDSARWVVTFDNHSIGPGFDRPGFGEDFLRAQGISAIHVLGRGDDWYQYPDMAEACAAVRAAVAGAARVVAYGSSMGGYAAIRFGEAVGAHAVLALSPQYSNDPARVSWEVRWTQDAARIAWRPELGGPLRAAGEVVLIYDPVGDDGRHAALIEAEVPAISIRLPHAAHPVATYLVETGLLRPILLDVLGGGLDAGAIRAQARAARGASSVYLGTLAERQPASRFDTALALARRAADLATESLPLGLLSLANVLTRAGRHEEALCAHRRIIELSRRDSLYLIHYANALLAAGEIAEAEAAAREVVTLRPRIGHLRHWRAGMLWQLGSHREALAEQVRAARLEPDNPLHHKTLLRYRRKARLIRVTGAFRALAPRLRPRNT